MIGKSNIDFLKGASVEALDNFQQGNYQLPNIYLWMKNLIFLETYNFKRHPEWRKRCDAVSSITDMKKYIPWYLDCNRQRYPYWFGNLDPRNKLLYEALTNHFHPGFGSIWINIKFHGISYRIRVVFPKQLCRYEAEVDIVK